jgi:hypothetical protein
MKTLKHLASESNYICPYYKECNGLFGSSNEPYNRPCGHNILHKFNRGECNCATCKNYSNTQCIPCSMIGEDLA